MCGVGEYSHHRGSTGYKVSHNGSEPKLSCNVKTVEAFAISNLGESTVTHQVDYHAQVTLSAGREGH